MDQIALFEQNQADVTIAYTDHAMQVTFNFAMDRPYQQVFQRMARGLVWIEDCTPDSSVNRYSENTSFLLTFANGDRVLYRIPEIQAEVRALAEKHVSFVLAQPTQTTLF